MSFDYNKLKNNIHIYKSIFFEINEKVKKLTQVCKLHLWFILHRIFFSDVFIFIKMGFDNQKIEKLCISELFLENLENVGLINNYM